MHGARLQHHNGAQGRQGRWVRAVELAVLERLAAAPKSKGGHARSAEQQHRLRAEQGRGHRRKDDCDDVEAEVGRSAPCLQMQAWRKGVAADQCHLRSRGPPGAGSGAWRGLGGLTTGVQTTRQISQIDPPDSLTTKSVF